MRGLPDSWTDTRIDELAFVEMGQSPKSKYYNTLRRGLPFFQGKAEFGPLFPTTRKWCSQPTKIAEAGDILLSVRAPVGPTNLAAEKCCIGRGLAAIRGEHLISQKFLLYQLRHLETWLAEQGTGTTFKAISGPFVRSLQVVVAPSNEQRRIADKLDAVLARVDACLERLDRIPAILARFRQSVLAAATSGRLTEDWREETGRPFAWRTSTVGELVDRIEAGLNVKCEERPPLIGERGLVKISAVTWGTYNDDESKTLPRGKPVSESARIELGDFLITRANTLELVGACVIVHRVTRPVYLSDKVLRLVMPDAVKPWLMHVLQSDVGRRQIERLASGNQLSMRNLSQANLRAVKVPMPDDDERAEICERVRSLLSTASRLEASHRLARAKVEELTPALLAKAFRGELVPQDPNDEPASLLLERIRVERAAASPQARKSKGERRIGTAKQEEEAMLSRSEIDGEHLAIILKGRGPVTSEALWAASQLSIDDFYDQLKDEEARGLLVERRSASPTAQWMLEAAG